MTPYTLALFDMWRRGDTWDWARLSGPQMGTLRDAGATHVVVDLYWDLIDTLAGYRWDFYDDYMADVRACGLPCVARIPFGAPHDMEHRVWGGAEGIYHPVMADPRHGANYQRLGAFIRATHDRYHFDAYEVGGGHQAEAVVCAGLPEPDGALPLDRLLDGHGDIAEMVEAFLGWVDFSARLCGDLARELWISHVVFSRHTPDVIASGMPALNYLMLPYIRVWEDEFALVHDFNYCVDHNAAATQLYRHAGRLGRTVIGAEMADYMCVEQARRARRMGMDGLLCWTPPIFSPAAPPDALQRFEMAADILRGGYTIDGLAEHPV